MATYKEQNKLNVPHLRFPEFHGEWEKCKVSELLDFYSTNSLSWDQLEYGTDNMLNLHYGLIHVGLPTMVDLSKDILPAIKKENKPKNFELCKEGDIAFADASEDTNEVAKAIEFYTLEDKAVVCGLHTKYMEEINPTKLLLDTKAMLFPQQHFIIRFAVLHKVLKYTRLVQRTSMNVILVFLQKKNKLKLPNYCV